MSIAGAHPTGEGHPGARIRAVALGLVLAANVACGGDQDKPADTGAQATGDASTGPADSSDSGGGEPNAWPTVQLQFSAAAQCGADGSLVARATHVGCVSPPPAPCTLPMPPRVYTSASQACPSSATDGQLRVAIESPGRYEVALVAVAADGTETTQCYANGDESVVIVDNAAFDENPTIDVMPLGGPC